MSFLINQAKHDPSAFAKLYEVHVNGVYQYCAYRLPTKQEAQDVTSEVWETALHHISDLKSDHPIVFKAWLFKIAKNAINKKYTEKKSNALSLDETAETIKDKNHTPHENSKNKDEQKHLKALVAALPQQQRETVALHFFSELKNKEIAQLMELSEKTVASNLCRALATLRIWLKKMQ